MLRLRYLVPVLGLSSLIAAACSEGDGVTVGGDAGEGGEAMGGEGPGPGGTGTGGSMTGGGAGGEDTGQAGGCAEDGSGTLVIEISGLPAEVDADVLITGPDELAVTAGDTLSDVAAGSYTVTAARVYDADPIVRTVFDATVTAPDFCLADGDSHTIEVTYAAIPSSNKLWMPTDEADELAGFTSAAIAESGMTDASVSIDGPGSKAIAFDRDGNLWAFGPTVADPHVVRFPAALLGASATLEPDISMVLPEVACLPAMRNLAFDSTGNLWLSVCGDEIHRVGVADVVSSDMTMSDVLLTGATEPQGLAFDSEGNLWVGGGPALQRFDAARLGDTDADPPDLELTVTPAVGNAPMNAGVLAFDKAGNLWGIDIGSNAVFQVAAAALADTGTQTVQANVSFVVSVTALPNAPAFDEGNGLWLSLDTGNFGRLSPTQLGASAGTGAPVAPALIISSNSVGTDLPVAFFPAPEGLPLFHSLPAP